MAKATPTFIATDDKLEIARQAVRTKTALKQLVGSLSGEDRRLRQLGASAIAEVARLDASLLKPYAEELADALHRPESQTRWEVLGVFTQLVNVDCRLVDKALPGAEAALHDEESGVVRLAAFRLLTAYGATTAHRSERVWPLLSEAVRCYHGDAEFHAMLASLYTMTSGAASDEVKTAAADLMAFDAENAKGILKRRAQSIVSCRPKKTRAKK